VVTSIPTNCLPRQLALGAVTGHEIELIERRTVDVEPDDLSDDLGQRGQILWIRGITRLQHQVSLDTPEELLLIRYQQQFFICHIVCN